jgi:hypothetical protein
MPIQLAHLRKLGPKWKVDEISAKKGDIIVWYKNNKRFQLWFPANNPFGASEIHTGVTRVYCGLVTGKKPTYTYAMYMVDEPKPIARWVEGHTPPTIIIR